jgi:hypothetical protein
LIIFIIDCNIVHFIGNVSFVHATKFTRNI